MIKTFTISDTSPAAASTATGDVIRGLAAFDFLTIDAALVGATGGTLDVYLQREVGLNSGVWRDWLHYTQLTAGGAAVKYFCSCGRNTAGSNTITAVGDGTSVVLAANSFLGGHPGDAIRPVYVAGVSTSAGAAVTILITGHG